MILSNVRHGKWSDFVISIDLHQLLFLQHYHSTMSVCEMVPDLCHIFPSYLEQACPMCRDGLGDELSPR